MSQRQKGILLAALGAICWGINGAFVDLVFSRYEAPVTWVVGCRLLFAGICILIYANVVRHDNIFLIFKERRDAISLIIFAMTGMLISQFTFFLSISYNGAGLATILQFTSPIFIYLLLVLRREKSLHWREILYIALAIMGIAVIVTNGQFSQLAVSGVGFVIGIISAIGVVFYTLQPRRILKKYDTPVVVGWGMVLAGILVQCIHPFWRPGFPVTGQILLYLAFIILVGTALSFSLFLGSLNHIEASLANILASIEPLVANILAPLLLGIGWTRPQLLGSAVVLLAVVLFANQSQD